MEQLVAGCVQLRLQLPPDLEEIDANLQRFVRMSEVKRVRLLIFPQYTGLMTAVPVTRGPRTGLLRQADQARRTGATVWTKARARLAGGAANMLGASFPRALEDALLQQPDALWESYSELFSRLARRHGITVVAGTSYLVDPSDGAIRHLALVFGPDGEQLGQQAAVSLPQDEHVMVQPGNQWQVIPTPAGRLGILIGNDVLYPEPARILAYAGAEVLIGLGACTHPAQYHRQRLGLVARVEENQLYGALSFVVGYNPLTPGDEQPYVGRSLLAAPVVMTPRYNGISVEMGTDSTEGLITAEWNYPRLRDLWTQDDTPVRATMPVAQAGRILSAIYAGKLTIDEATRIGGPEELMPSLRDSHEAPAVPELSSRETLLLPQTDADSDEEPPEQAPTA